MKHIIKYSMSLGFAMLALLSKTECYGMAPAPQGSAGASSLIGLVLPLLVIIALGIILGRILLHRIDMGQRKIVGAIILIFGIGLAVYGRTALKSFGDVMGFYETIVGLVLVIPGGMLLFSKGKKT